jgi:plastocyanin
MDDETMVTAEEPRHSRRRVLQGAIGGVGAAALVAGSGLTVHQVLAKDEDDDDDDRDSSGSGSGHDDHDSDSDDTVPVTGEIPAGSIEVRIVNDDSDGFQPNDLTVDLGQSVTFVNAHDDEHTATGSGFDTGNIEPGATVTLTLDEPGRFGYACNYHPEMTGTISVRDENGNVPEQSTQTQDVPADTIEVQIVNFAFEPATVSVPAGGTIVWINNDSAPHTATALDGSFDSNIFDPGASFSWQFSEPGTVPYRCSLHPAMEGTVEVTGEATGGGEPTTDESAQGMVGAWVVSVEPEADAGLAPQQALATFHGDGVISATFATLGEDGPEFSLSAAHGTWEVDGDGAFTATIAAMLLDAGQHFAGLITFAADGRLDDSGNQISGSFSFETTDDAGERLASGEGSIEGQRVGATSEQPVADEVELDATPVTDELTDDAGGSATVTIVDFAFDPPEIEVAAGTSVSWINEDTAPHTATADDGTFDTGRLDEGAEGSVTFDEPGAYAYHCDFHPDMVGTVVVK